jgi:hypothetical protein
LVSNQITDTVWNVDDGISKTADRDRTLETISKLCECGLVTEEAVAAKRMP